MIPIPREKLLDCLQIMLAPFCRFCAHYSIHINEVSEALRRGMVKAASDEIRVVGKRVTASRIKAVCGLHRREIARLLDPSQVKEGQESLIVRILGQWHNHKKFSVRPGKPKSLTFEGKESEFSKLVASVSQELKPGTILFELERQGVVLVKGKHLKVLKSSYAPVGNYEQLLVFLAKDTADLFDAGVENIFDPQIPPSLHATTEYDNIDPSALVTIRKWLLAEGNKFHSRVRNYLARFDRDVSRSSQLNSGGIRVALGTFGLVKTLPKSEK